MPLNLTEEEQREREADRARSSGAVWIEVPQLRWIAVISFLMGTIFGFLVHLAAVSL